MNNTKTIKAAKTLGMLYVAATLCLLWVLSTLAALGFGTLTSWLGGSESGAAAVAGPPCALGFTLGLQTLLRRSAARRVEAEARREGEELMRDPEFLESLAQMARGEHRIVRTREEEDQDG